LKFPGSSDIQVIQVIVFQEKCIEDNLAFKIIWYFCKSGIQIKLVFQILTFQVIWYSRCLGFHGIPVAWVQVFL